MSITSKNKPKGLLYIIQNEKVYSASSKTRRLYLTKFMENDIKDNKDYLYGRWQGRFGYIVKKITPMLKYRGKGSDDNDFRNEVSSVS